MRKVLSFLGLSAASISALFVFVACSTEKPVARSYELTPQFDGIFSIRPQVGTHGLFLIKLKSQPFLAVANIKNASPEIRERQIQLVSAEQDELLAKLRTLSSDIKPVFRYRMVLNGIAVVAPLELKEKIGSLANVVSIESSAAFKRPTPVRTSALQAEIASLQERNSVTFIGTEAVHSQGFRGQGIKVGIIDTGIDFTHSMFGGEGTEDAFLAVDPKQVTDQFPTAKVIGGFDFVGTDYDSSSADFMKRLPTPDSNPLDEAGHGTHVAGTVAGLGDGTNTYSGVAPEASLYALKVFGANGSTTDAVVIAALEYSADPNSDGEISDRLDVVNLSLGGGYGEAHLLYTEAIENLSRGGVSVVASAGNSGDQPYIVGAPSVSDAAISVAASIDDMDHNWRFDAVKFSSSRHPEVYVEAVQGPITKPISESGDIRGALVHVGLADQDFNEDLRARLKGHVALIDRGVVPFSDKIRRAFEAGSVGVVMVNNVPEDPIPMGGEGTYDIPGIMVSKELGDQLRGDLELGEVHIQFRTEHKIEKPERIDTVTDFSSQGPRSLDALVKPEIAAPGEQVISAQMGGGRKGIAMSGTSMAGPHMAGVMALLKQARPGLETSDLKGLVMGTAKPLLADEKTRYPVSRQGAGRVRVDQALVASIVALPVSISLGEVPIESRKVLQRRMILRNLSENDANLNLDFEGSPFIKMIGVSSVQVPAKGDLEVHLRFRIESAGVTEMSGELDGWIRVTENGEESVRVPVLAVVNKLSGMTSEGLVVRSTSAIDSQGAVADLTIVNHGVNRGEAYVFNLIGVDERKSDPMLDPFRSRACDLAASGYRVIQKNEELYLQVAAKLYEPVTTWDSCEISVLIDGDGDGEPDQELVGAKQDHLPGLSQSEFSSMLLDFEKARGIRRQYEEATRAGMRDIREDYIPALQALGPMVTYEHSTLSILEAPVRALQRRPTGELKVKIAASYQEPSAIEGDDFLSDKGREWFALNVSEQGAGFVGMPENLKLEGGQSQVVSLVKGAGSETLVLFFPFNKPVYGGFDSDLQMQVVTPLYDVESRMAAQ